MRLALTRVLVALGLAVLLGRTTGVFAATVRSLPLRDLATRADRIVVAETVEVRCTFKDVRGDAVPVTLVTVRVHRTLKGAAANQLMLEFPGGRLEGDALDIPGIPALAVGDRDVLFLQAGGLHVSPLIGVMQGRFRILTAADPQRERVAFHDGRPLTTADLPATGQRPVLQPEVGQATSQRPVKQPEVGQASRLSPASAGPVTLAAFERAVRELLSGAGQPEAKAQASLGAESSSVEASFPSSDPVNEPQQTPLIVDLNLGASPALLDGCLDWACALASREAFRRMARVWQPTAGGSASTAIERVSLEWGRSVFGFALDDDTAALTVVRANRDGVSTRVVFNDRLAWNSGAAASANSQHIADRTPEASSRVLDLPAVAVRELSLVSLLRASETTADSAGSFASAVGRRTLSDRVPRSRSASPSESLDDTTAACDSAQALMNPTFLMFVSPDHALMTGYQVGFFRPGAAFPAQIVDLPLGAFMIRRVVDLPPAVAQAMQSSLIASIRSAGLATPIGDIYTYRVRGVWPGGTTDWSNASEPFVRCF